jgi:AcrR family transcriptional regulator
MRGRKPVRPLPEVADAAVTVFTDKGFRQAGISDVSAELGLSHGALYTYVDSKQALLYLALARAVQPEIVAGLPVPVTAPPPEQLVAMLITWARAQDQEALPQLGTGGPGTWQAERELGAIVDALYGFVERNRRAIQLIEQCAADLPELAQWFYVGQRRALLDRLTDYLRGRIAAGKLRPVPDAPAAARFINETIAWFAMHRHGDADSEMLDDDACRATVRHLILAAFLPAAE